MQSQDKNAEQSLKSEKQDHDIISPPIQPILSLDRFTEGDSRDNKQSNVEGIFKQQNETMDQYENELLSPLNKTNNLNASLSHNLTSSEKPENGEESLAKTIKEERIEIEKGLIGLRIEIRKIEEEYTTKLSNHIKDFEEVRDDLIKFQQEVHDSFLVTREEMHRRYTEFKAHINEILLEFKDSILIIQSYVDNQLVINKRDRIDINTIIEVLIK